MNYKQVVGDGKCPYCGSKLDPGKVHCDRHLEDWRNYNKLGRQARKSKGLCTRCKTPVEPGKKMCLKHLELARRYMADTRLRKTYKE